MRWTLPGSISCCLETVGTGQSEMDVAEVADVRVVISAPGLGDDIQAMKSGLLEIADILVVNKGDREGAELTLQQLLGALSIRSMRSHIPVLKTTATTGEGVPELVTAMREVGTRGAGADPLARRRRRARYLIARAAADIVARRVKEDSGREVDGLADEVLSGRVSPDVAAHKLLGR